jgi:micrococcal nuclease
MYTYQCTVIKIIDGDTIDVDIDLGFNVKLYKQRVRLYGIDTPESRTRDLEVKKRGLLSKEFLKTQAPIGSKITLKSLERGKFGRILGTIWKDMPDLINTDSLNDVMIKNHYAVPYYGGNKDKLNTKHQENKQQLIKKGIL